jgi:hypothetical protein
MYKLSSIFRAQLQLLSCFDIWYHSNFRFLLLLMFTLVLRLILALVWHCQGLDCGRITSFSHNGNIPSGISSEDNWWSNFDYFTNHFGQTTFYWWVYRSCVMIVGVTVAIGKFGACHGHMTICHSIHTSCQPRLIGWTHRVQPNVFSRWGCSP